MNRRGFLGTLLGAAGVAIADPERLIWTPKKKLISIPRVSTLDTFRELYIKPALEEIAAQVDADIAAYFKYGCARGYGWVDLSTIEHRVFVAS